MSRMSPAAEEELVELIADRLDVLLKDPGWEVAIVAVDLAREVADWLSDAGDLDLWP